MALNSTLWDYCDCCGVNYCCGKGYDSDREEIHDDDAVGLSHVGNAAYDCLRTVHDRYHHSLWNVTSGKIVMLDHTPKQAYTDEPVEKGHSNWLAEKFGEIISRTEIWCDVTSLSPPDGYFMECFKKAIKTLHEKDKEITIRMMFGSIAGAPVDCNTVIKNLTEGIPETSKLRLWVGAWRKGISWNHSKIIAVDGKYLHTGGHNLYDSHYLQFNPISDLSIEMHGRCAHDGHLYANEQWRFVHFMQRSPIGFVVDKIIDGLELPIKSRVTVSEFPEGVAHTFPPTYKKNSVPHVPSSSDGVKDTRIITMGRYGTLTPHMRRPADDAMAAMLSSAKRVIHMSLQDLGPMCIPNTMTPMPGTVWPKPYLNAIAAAIWKRDVLVEMVFSNPKSVPAAGDPAKEFYGNGWTCDDVASEVIKRVKKQFPEAEDAALRKKIAEKLHISYLRGTHGQTWEDGMGMGLHTKHFIVDDTCFYIGSQNLYVCDLAEWGVVIDSEEETKKVMAQYWNPVWKTSYNPADCDVQRVMDGLSIDRDGEDPHHLSQETKLALEKSESLEK